MARRIGTAAQGAALVVGVLAVAPVAADKPHSVTVLGSSGQVAQFTSAKCRQSKGSFVALTRKTETGYQLFVSIERFTGFHTYQLEKGLDADPYVSLDHGGQPGYSTLHVPSFPVPGAGQIRFARHGKLMGVGFSAAWDQAGTDAVTFTGVLKCHYPKKNRKK